ncbi:MAG: hypothetical protein AAF614_17935 [Chloroflexota bacterium]
MQTLIAQIQQNKERVDQLRKVAFVISLFLIITVVSIELARPFFTTSPQSPTQTTAPTLNPDALCTILPPADCVEVRELLADSSTQAELAQFSNTDLPGWGISTMAFIDGIVLFTTLLIGLSYIIPAQTTGRIQGVATLIFALVLISLGIARGVAIFAELMVMVGLLLSIPFGTLVYLAKYGSFDVGSATAVSNWLFSLKILFGLCLILAQERYLQNKGLVLLILTALLSSLIVTLLHTLVPGIIVSITDAVAALIVVILALIWTIFLLIGSLPAIFKAVKSIVKS